MRSADRWNEMNPATKQGLAVGALAGFFLAAFFYWYSQNPTCFLLVPFAAVMGAAPQLIKPRDEDD